MSTNTHEQSKTCTDIVNDLAMWAEALEGAQDLGDPRMVASQMRVRAAALKRSQPALARHPGAVAAVATLQSNGWTYTVGHERWKHPRPDEDVGVLAAEELRRQGYTWSANLAVWMPPAPSADAQRANAAEATLGGLGYEWAPKRSMWVCTAPAPAKPDVPVKFTSAASALQGLGWTYNAPASSWECPPAPAGGEVPGGGLPDWPVGVQTFHERAAYQRGVADGRRVGALREAAEATITARYQGLLTAQMDKALGALRDALPHDEATVWAAFPVDPVRAAAVRVVRHAGKVDGAALPELDKALSALDKALVADGSLLSAWDAEECRNAALEVLREFRPVVLTGAARAALARLGRAVQREQ